MLTPAAVKPPGRGTTNSWMLVAQMWNGSGTTWDRNRPIRDRKPKCGSHYACVLAWDSGCRCSFISGGFSGVAGIRDRKLAPSVVRKRRREQGALVWAFMEGVMDTISSYPEIEARLEPLFPTE